MVDEDTQRVAGPSEEYGGNWDNPRVRGTVLDGAEVVREVVERYRKAAEAGVVMDTREAEGTHSRVEEGKGGVHERDGSIVRRSNGSRGRGGALLTWEEDLGETPTAGTLARERF